MDDAIARLDILTGQTAEGPFFLPAGRYIIGRDPANDIVLTDAAVSRQHCTIRVGEVITVEDMASANGTHLNGKRVTDAAAMGDGDRLTVGTVTLVLWREWEREEQDPGDIIPEDTVRIHSADALYPAGNTRMPDNVAMQDLDALLRAASELARVRTRLDLERALIEAAFRLVAADRGAIISAEQNPGASRRVRGWKRDSGTPEIITISRAIVSAVYRHTDAILSNNVRATGEWESLQSTDIPVHAVVAAPLMGVRHPVAVLYLQAESPGVTFDENHLQRLMGLCSIAALALEGVGRIEALEAENRRLSGDLGLSRPMVGSSPKMMELYGRISRIAPTNVTVLLTGETGTGKELAARALHESSGRAQRAFVSVNCAMLQREHLQSELFGHERGAFTGAIAQRRGKFELASEGTLFLDEVGELGIDEQAKLLRVLQEGEIERLGGQRPIKVDIRLIAATNRDLPEMIRKGLFREDLWHRLKVVKLEMPPLRERRDDIPPLADSFLRRLALRARRRVIGFRPDALDLLVAYEWPGNVRELENAIEHGVVLGEEEFVRPEDLPEEVHRSGPGGRVRLAPYQEQVNAAKRRILENTLRECGGDMKSGASRLGIHENNLYRLIRTLGIRDTLDAYRRPS